MLRQSNLWSSLANWSTNLQRLWRGRPPWSAGDEFAYYRVDERVIREHREHQVEFARVAYTPGLRIARALDLLDTHRLRGTQVLDLGAGECVLSAALASCGANVWATDAVPKQIWAAAEYHQAQARQGHARPLHFVIADAQDLPFADGAFDIVVANLVLHHIEPLVPLLREVRRVLRPGGIFAALEPTPLVGALVHEATSANESPIAPRQVLAALREAEFSNERSSYYWSRLETSALGPLSPGYRVTACRPLAGEPPVRSESILRRTLLPMQLPGLDLDAGCSFAELARAQEREILALLQPERE